MQIHFPFQQMHGLLCCSLSLPLQSPVLLHADNRNVQNIHMCPLEFPETVFRYSADAALAASLFHYKELEISQVKDYLADRGISVRR